MGHFDGLSVMYPFLVREIDRQPGAVSCRDISSPYGYGGPAVWGQGSKEAAAAEFWARFDDWARAQGIVSEFVRFGLFPESRLPYPGETWVVARHVVRMLQVPVRERRKVGKNVDTAVRSGVTVIGDPTGAHLESFLDIYRHTLDRRKAAECYRYPRCFFERLAEAVPQGMRYFHAVIEERIVATELVLVSEHQVYSFLGGTLEPFFACRPSDLLKCEIIRWAREQGKSAFVLGGGYRPDDGIFRFKLAFAPGGATDYVQGGRVLRPDLYDALVAERSAAAAARPEPWNPPARFFPRYRA